MTQKPSPAEHDTPAGATAEATAHPPAALQTLQQAMRRVRVDDAERAGVVADLRAARMGRLELLREALQPLVAQIPRDVDMFDVGLMPGVNPRLFIDMIGFVEMGRDARLYRFVQDTRHGRTLLAESVDIDRMVDAITDYVARRMLERDKALAADIPTVPGEKPPARSKNAVAEKKASSVRALAPARPPQPAEELKRRPAFLRIIGVAFAFLIDLLGSITFFTILAAIGWVIWNHLHGQVG